MRVSVCGERGGNRFPSVGRWVLSSGGLQAVAVGGERDVAERMSVSFGWIMGAFLREVGFLGGRSW